MKHTARYVSLTETIYFYISEANLSPAAFYRLWTIAFRGLRTLGMDFAQEPKTRKLSMLPNKTFELPGDYMNWSKVGVLNSNGEVATLRYNKDLTYYAGSSTDRASNDTGTLLGLDFRNYYYNYPYNDGYCNLFGAGGGLTNIGEFTVDEEQGIIILDPSFGYDYIILEYLSAPEKDGDYLIPVQIQEALISWIRWVERKSLPQGRRSNLGQRQLDRKDFFNDKRLARMRMNPIRLWQMNETMRENSGLILKG